jgi:hypothetical protein
MMNLRLKLREPKGQVIPKGPSFRWACTIRTEIDGTQIQFKAPYHWPLQSNDEAIIPERHYNADNKLRFRDYYDKEDAERGLVDHWRKARFFYRAWAFCGPWFTGPQAELSMSLTIIKVINYPEGTSLFHPRALELVIGDYLTNMHSHHLDETRGYIQEFKAPVDWRALHHLPVNTARFKMVPEDFSPHKVVDHHVIFPIADNMMASFLFWPSQLLSLPQAELDKRVSAKPMHELMEKIIASIELKLSPEAQDQQQAALAGMEDTSLIRDYPPLQWGRNNSDTKAAQQNKDQRLGATARGIHLSQG